jgi:hypothetical protein
MRRLWYGCNGGKRGVDLLFDRVAAEGIQPSLGETCPKNSGHGDDLQGGDGRFSARPTTSVVRQKRQTVTSACAAFAESGHHLGGKADA